MTSNNRVGLGLRNGEAKRNETIYLIKQRSEGTTSTLERVCMLRASKTEEASWATLPQFSLLGNVNVRVHTVGHEIKFCHVAYM